MKLFLGPAAILWLTKVFNESIYDILILKSGISQIFQIVTK